MKMDSDYIFSSFLDAVESEEIINFTQRNPTYKAVRDVLMRSLFSNGITYTTDGMEPTTLFQNVLDRHWAHFAKEMLDNFLMFGFSPYQFIPIFIHLPNESNELTNKQQKRKRRKRKVLIPHVPTYGSYKARIGLNKKTSLISIRFYNGDEDIFLNKENKDIQYLIFENSLPCPRSGRINSKIACLLKHYTIVNEMYRFALQSEYIRARPTIFTKTQKDTSKKSDDNDFFNSVTAIESLSEKNMLRKNENKYLNNDIEDQQGNYKAKRDSEAISSARFQMKLKTQWEDNIFHLPNGTEMASTSSVSATKNEAMAYEKVLEKHIYAVLGVPESIFGIQRLNTVKNTDKLMFLRRTLSSYKNSIENALNHVYEKLYGNEEGLKLSLNVSPLIEYEEIKTFYEEGIITNQEKVGQLRKLSGLKKIDMNDLPPSIDTILLLHKEGAIDDLKKKELLLSVTGFKNTETESENKIEHEETNDEEADDV